MRPVRLPLYVITTVLILNVGCSGDRAREQAPEKQSAPASQTTPAGDLFIDATEGSGLSFIHFNGMTGEFLYPKVMAPGVALLDYDNDGDLDVVTVQGRMLGNQPVARALVAPQGAVNGRLFRNDGVSDGRVRFTDVTEIRGAPKTPGADSSRHSRFSPSPWQPSSGWGARRWP